MGNLERPSKNHHVQCKKHPKHKQSPGVCSLCLNEKLSQVSKTRLRRMRTDSSSCSSSSSSEHSSSSCSSPYSSPMHRRYRFISKREGISNKGSLSFMFRGKNNANELTKSRSLAFVPSGGDDDAYSYRDNYKKKTTRGGFWSKLLHPRRKKIENGLMHSSTMREIRRTIVV